MGSRVLRVRLRGGRQQDAHARTGQGGARHKTNGREKNAERRELRL